MAKNSKNSRNFRPDLEMIIGRGPLKIFIWNAAEGWPVEYVSENISSFGYSCEDFYSGEINYSDIIHPDDVKRIQNEVSLFSKQKCSEFQQSYRILTKDGKIKWVDDHTIIRYNENGEITHYDGLIIDTTEKKQIREDLIESQKHFKALFENIPVSLQLYDDKGLLLYVNKMWEEIFHTQRESVISIYNIMQNPILIEMGIIDKLQDVLKGISIKMPDDEYDTSQPDNPGEKRWLRTQVYPLKDIHQKVKFFVIMQRDITEQKKMDKELLKTQRLESISLLAGGIAHDFNNVLVGILGNINLMQMEELSPNLDVYLCELEKAAFRAQDLASQLLTFSKGGSPIKKVESITDIIQESANIVLHGSKSKCIFNFKNDLPNVEVDFGQINQVMNNLLINANQAMPNGGIIGVKVTFEENYENSDKQISKNNYVKVSIIDEGLGIPLEYQNRIFTPYFTTKETGNGLGLATAYSIIKKHGGYIDFLTSEKGTNFFFYLPTTEKKCKEKKQKKKYKKFTGSILIMDDDELVSNTLRSILQKIGFLVDISRDGNETVKKCDDAIKNKRPYDIIIMDLTIPGGMGGEETMKQTKKTHPNLKVIVSSGYSNNPILANFRELGFSGMLKKPYTITNVQKVISEVLSFTSN